MKKIGLILEGGGFRGAYTAGALTWLLDNNIKFEYGVGISSGAVLLAAYELENREVLYKMVVEEISDPTLVGIQAFKTEGHYVAYRHILDRLKNNLHFDISPLIEEKPNMEVGLYDLQEGKTIFKGPEDFDVNLDLFLAACALPIASARVSLNGKEYLDGGITKMIPIERAMEKDLDGYFVITTKPVGYVRKKGNPLVTMMMKVFYRNCPQMVKDYKVRHINYNKQMEIVYDLVKQGKAFLRQPTQTIKVARFKGDKENLDKLFQLGYQDMEDRKDEIIAFLKEENI